MHLFPVKIVEGGQQKIITQPLKQHAKPVLGSSVCRICDIQSEEGSQLLGENKLKK